MVKILECPTWKYIMDVMHHGYKPTYLLAMTYAFEKSRAIRMLQNARDYRVISQSDYAQFVTVLEKRV